MSRTRQSQSRVLKTNSTLGGHHELPMEYVETPLSVQHPRRHEDPDISANNRKESPQDHSTRGISSSQGSNASTLSSQSDPSAPASFTNLNKDILTIIFKYFLAPINVSYSGEIAQRRTTLLLLNSAFNTLIYKTPSLWAHIPISGPIPNHTRAERFLRYAKRVGLWWVFDLRNDEFDPEWATEEVVHSLLKTYLTPTRMEHTTHLHIILNTSSLLSTIFQYLRFPAPALQEFKVVKGEMYVTLPLDLRHLTGLPPPTYEIEDGVFGGHAPVLRLLQMHFTSISRTRALLTSITGGGGPTSNIQHLDLSKQREMHPENFYSLLEAISSSLKKLVLRNAGPKIESGNIARKPPSTWTSDYQQVSRGESRSYAVDLPSLTSLIIGGMTANYLASLLSTLHFRPITFLGVHGISMVESERVWGVLSQQPALLSEPIQGEQQGHSDRAFSSIETLEMFDLLPSPDMIGAYPRPVEGRVEKNRGAKGYGFHGFLSDQPSLTHIMMRKVGIEFVKAVADMSQPDKKILSIPAPALECLEVCCIVNEDLNDPEVLEDVNTALIEVIRSRLDCGHRIARLHLDGDEWRMQKETRKNFVDGMAQIGEEFNPPIVHWDARAPFFADYYDSTEI